MIFFSYFFIQYMIKALYINCIYIRIPTPPPPIIIWLNLFLLISGGTWFVQSCVHTSYLASWLQPIDEFYRKSCFGNLLCHSFFIFHNIIMTLSVWHIYLFQIMSKPFGDGIDFRFQTFLMHKFKYKYAFMCNPWLYKFLNDSFHFQI